MGATCSSTALTRYNLIKKRLADKECLTFEAADGLLPRSHGKGPPVWLFGENHSLNESDTRGTTDRNCALVLDLVTQAVSDCESNNAEVVFIYENAVISDHPLFFEKDPNDRIMEEGPHHDVRRVREIAKELAGLYRNVRPVYMDVFGRVRLYLADELKYVALLQPRDVVPYIQDMLETELQEFWVTSGKHSTAAGTTKASRMVGKAMIEINEQQLHTRITSLGERLDHSPFKIFLGILCAKVAQKVLADRSGKVSFMVQRSDERVSREIDEAISYLFSEKYKTPQVLRQPIADGHVTQFDLKSMMMFSAMFNLVVKAGDAVLNEYITSLPSSRLVVMHAGFAHTGNQRKWLLGGEYDTETERLSADALDDEDFLESRQT